MHMTATIANPIDTEIPDLENLVGLIRIEAESETEATRLFAELDRWLEKNRWSHLVKAELAAVSHGCEVAFLPGEHQSNPAVKLAFHAVPDFSQIRHRLSHWLYELM